MSYLPFRVFVRFCMTRSVALCLSCCCCCCCLCSQTNVLFGLDFHSAQADGWWAYWISDCIWKWMRMRIWIWMNEWTDARVFAWPGRSFCWSFSVSGSTTWILPTVNRFLGLPLHEREIEKERERGRMRQQSKSSRLLSLINKFLSPSMRCEASSRVQRFCATSFTFAFFLFSSSLSLSLTQSFSACVRKVKMLLQK